LLCTVHRRVQLIMLGEAKPPISGQGRGLKLETQRAESGS